MCPHIVIGPNPTRDFADAVTASQDLLDRKVRGLMALLCEGLGHQPTRDQCNRPEHDYCVWCRAKTPGQAHAPVAESQAPAGKAGDARVATVPGAPSSGAS